MDKCIESLKFFSKDYVYTPDDHNNFYLEEKAPEGIGKVYFSSSSQCIVIKANSSGPLVWSFKNGKISEGAILTKDDSGYHLHYLEMKSKLTYGEWAKAQLQFEGMHLTALAVIRLLGVTEIASATCYIAYKQDAMTASKSADLVLMKTFVGMANPLGGVDSWAAETCELPITGLARIRKAQRDVSNDANFGVIN